ncbi:MAG: response regulator [Alphaproteobacteria bacterium]|nr:response regulator [Alphaproteobacteria bacterium]
MPQRPYADYKVLILDDHQLSCKLLVQQLESMGFEDIESANDGATGLAMMETKPYDLVIFDWMMPVMDGLTFLKACVQNERHKKCGFIALSAEAEPTSVLSMLKSGAASYMTKPVLKHTLEKNINNVLDYIEDKSE